MTDWMPKDIRERFRREGAKGGRKAASRMTEAQKTARARKAGRAGAKARWGKTKRNKPT